MVVRKILFLLSLSLPLFVSAQTNGLQFLVTWKANSFAESGFMGKIFPTRGSNINVRFELIDGGKLAAIANNEVRWFVDGKLIQRGDGLKSINFTAGQFASNHSVKIIVANYRGADLEKIITIPVKKGEVVVKVPYPNREIIPQANQFEALLYNWNILAKNLVSFRWSANGEGSTGDNSSKVTIDVPGDLSGGLISLSVVAQNLVNEIDIANASVNLLVK